MSVATSNFVNRKAVGIPSVNFDVEALVNDFRNVVISKSLTNGGVKVKTFEEQLSQKLGVKHVICVCNATIGLEVALKALDVKGTVIVPSFTFVATAHACKWIGLDVAFCDIDETTLLLDTNHLKSLITSKTGAIIPVHVYGRACDATEIEKIASANGIKVIYDAAHAFGSKYDDGCFVGSKGNCEVFSFHATKSLSSMEGGAIATNCDALATRVRGLINFGFSGYDNVKDIGTNAKMCEVAALYGIYSLSAFDALVCHNRMLFVHLNNLFAHQCTKDSVWAQNVILLGERSYCNMHYSVILWKNNGTTVDRDFVAQKLLEQNCQARKYFYPGVHAMSPYADAAVLLPHTESVVKTILCLPTGFQMSCNDVSILFQLLVKIWNDRIIEVKL